MDRRDPSCKESTSGRSGSRTSTQDTNPDVHDPDFSCFPTRLRARDHGFHTHTHRQRPHPRLQTSRLENFRPPSVVGVGPRACLCGGPTATASGVGEGPIGRRGPAGDRRPLSFVVGFTGPCFRSTERCHGVGTRRRLLILDNNKKYRIGKKKNFFFGSKEDSLYLWFPS